MKEKYHSNRINWIDAVKGFAILCVMFSHVQGPSDLRNWICTFHVPIFLILTGFLSAHKGCSDFPKIFIQNIPSYFVFSIAAIITQVFYDVFQKTNALFSNLLIGIWKTISGFGIYALWFIPSYLIAYYLFLKLLKFNKRIYTVSGILIGGILSTLIEYAVSFIQNTATSFIYNLIYFPLIAIFRGYACVVFIAIGYFSYYIIKKVKSYNKILPLITGLFFLLASWPLSKLLGYGVNFSVLSFGRFPGLYYFAASVSSFGIISIIYLIQTLIPLRILEYYGRNSLIIMITHLSLNLAALSLFLVNKIYPSPDTVSIAYYFHGFLCLLFLIIIEIPIIQLLNGKLNFLIKPKSFQKIKSK